MVVGPIRFAGLAAVAVTCLGLAACSSGKDQAASDNSAKAAAVSGVSGSTGMSGSSGAAGSAGGSGSVAGDRPAVELETLTGLTLPSWRMPADFAAPPRASSKAGDLAALQAKVAAEELPHGDQLAVDAIDPVGWIALAVDIGKNRALNPVRMARFVAIVAASMQGAVKANAALDSLPEPRSEDPSLDRADDAQIQLPSEHWSKSGPADSVATASAASTAIAKVFPSEKWRADLALGVAIRTSTLSGMWAAADLDRAQVLGAKAAEAVVAASSTDGAQTKGPFVQPPGGTWVPTPPVFAPPVDPGAGTWTLWNDCVDRDGLTASAGEILKTADVAAAAKKVAAIQPTLTDGDRRLADQWSLGPGTSTPLGVWTQTLSDQMRDRNIRVEDQAPALAMLATVEADAAVVTWHIKYTYSTERPITVIQRDIDPGWSPLLVTPAFPSFPSGHSYGSAAAATTLAALFPAQADEFAKSAAGAGDSRVVGGIHYWYDNSVGLDQGSSLAGACLAKWGAGSSKVTGESLKKLAVYAAAPK